MKLLLALVLMAGTALAGDHLDNGRSFSGVSHNGGLMSATTQLEQISLTIGGTTTALVWDPGTQRYEESLSGGLKFEVWAFIMPDGKTIYMWSLRDDFDHLIDWGQMS